MKCLKDVLWLFALGNRVVVLGCVWLQRDLSVLHVGNSRVSPGKYNRWSQHTLPWCETPAALFRVPAFSTLWGEPGLQEMQ